MIAKTYQTETTKQPSLDVHRSRETGFPSPATDHMEQRLNLHDHIVQRPTSTFFSRVVGDESSGLGVYNNDLLVIDRSLAYRHKTLVVADVEGELKVCRLWNSSKRWMLEFGDGSTIELYANNEPETEIWGVITHVVHSCV